MPLSCCLDSGSGAWVTNKVWGVFMEGCPSSAVACYGGRKALRYISREQLISKDKSWPK
jgi:hypothetical protein